MRILLTIRLALYKSPSLDLDGAALKAATTLASELVASLKMLAEEQAPLLTRADWERLVSSLDASFTSVQAALCAISVIEAPLSSAAAAARDACTTTLSTVVEVRITLHLRVSTTDPSHWAKLNTQLYPALNSAAVAAVWGWGRAVDQATRLLIDAAESKMGSGVAHQANRHDEESAAGSAAGSGGAGAEDAQHALAAFDCVLDIVAGGSTALHARITVAAAYTATMQVCPYIRRGVERVLFAFVHHSL